MIVVALFALGLLSVPLAGGKLGRVADLRLRRWPVLLLALAVQLIALKAPLPVDIAAGLNLSSYALGVWYLAGNLHIPGMWIVAVGSGTNILALIANRGVMPATEGALATAGLPATAGGGFVNSTELPDARIQFFGDIFALPESFPLHNVFSIGDIFIVLGALIAVHRICGSRLVPTGSSDFRELRRNRSFVSLWLAQGVSSMGDWVYTIAVAASLAGRDANPATFATMLVAQVGPAALMGAVGGPLVDRLPRKGVMMMSDLLRGLAVASLFLFGTPTIPHLYAVAVALGVLGALAQPALHASLPNVVHQDQLVAANGLVAATFNGAVMVGPMLGGILVSRLGFAPAIFINGLSFIGSALLVARVHLPPQPPCDDDWHPVAELREGFRYMGTTPIVRAVIVVMGIVMLAAAVKSPIEPLFVLRVLHARPEMLGFIGGAWGIGMVVGSVLAPGAARKWRRENLLWAGVAIVGVSVVAAAQVGAVMVLLVLWLLAGAGNAIGTVCYESLLQERTPDELRGRVFAASEAVLDTAFLGGVGLAAWMGSSLGARNAITVAGSLFLLAALLSRVLLTERASITVFRVHQPDEGSVVREALDVLAHAGSDEGAGHLGGVGSVRGEQAVGQFPERVPLRERLGIGDIQSGAADPALVQRAHEIGSDDVFATRHVDKPRMRFHGPQLGLADDAFGLGGEGESEHDEVGPGEDVVQPVRRDHACPTCEWLGLSPDDCCLNVEGGEQAQQRFGDAAAAQDGDAATQKGAPAVAAPGTGDRPLVEVP
ncbi:MAG TPA: MFS transporter [Acidimicrobiales bacterium]|nr:MFS transporter [Acidimicrobiales bacterium]